MPPMALNFKTTVLLTNAGSAPAAYTLRFNDDQGNIPVTGFELEAGVAHTAPFRQADR